MNFNSRAASMSQVKKFSSVMYVAGPLFHSVKVAYMYIFNWQNVYLYLYFVDFAFFAFLNVRSYLCLVRQKYSV